MKNYKGLEKNNTDESCEPKVVSSKNAIQFSVIEAVLACNGIR